MNPTSVAPQRAIPTFSFKKGPARAVTKRVVAKEMAVASAIGRAAKDQ
jgi:hypothetical protein